MRTHRAPRDKILENAHSSPPDGLRERSWEHAWKIISRTCWGEFPDTGLQIRPVLANVVAKPGQHRTDVRNIWLNSARCWQTSLNRLPKLADSCGRRPGSVPPSSYLRDAGKSSHVPLARASQVARLQGTFAARRAHVTWPNCPNNYPVRMFRTFSQPLARGPSGREYSREQSSSIFVRNARRAPRDVFSALCNFRYRASWRASWRRNTKRP